MVISGTYKNKCYLMTLRNFQSPHRLEANDGMRRKHDEKRYKTLYYGYVTAYVLYYHVILLIYVARCI
jgi:hypothetical protein